MKEKEKLILLVEDNPQDAELTHHALWKAGIVNDVLLARSGEEALAYISGRRRPPPHLSGKEVGLVLLDLRLPGMEGFDVLRQIRNDPERAKLPVIILTGAWSVEDILMGHRLKADSFLCKSLELDRLAEALEHLGLEKYLASDEEAEHRATVRPRARRARRAA